MKALREALTQTIEQVNEQQREIEALKQKLTSGQMAVITKEDEASVFHADPLELLGVSQFLTLHAPETEKTHHFAPSNSFNHQGADHMPRQTFVI